uniref:Trimethylamine-N-oxide reductase n=1 Tax=Dolomedes sulfureus TaxID=492288 RepID=A0A0P0DQI9_9ARAC|nr:trimethylamine-N-oxide reductase [Dolomedes sulfureus]
MKFLILLSISCFAIVFSEEEDFEPQIEDLKSLAMLLPLDVDEPVDFEIILKSMTREQKNEIKKLLDLLHKKMEDQDKTTS